MNRLPAFPSPVAIARTLGLFALMGFGALLASLVAASGNPLLVAMFVGLLAGTFLLARPTAGITLMIGLGLTMGVLLSTLGPGFDKLSWAVSLLGFFLFLPAFLNLRNLRQAPGFVYVVAGFSLIALTTTVIQWHSSAEVFAGIKRGLQATGLAFALALMPLKNEHIRLWRKMVLFVAALQLPFALYEFLVLVPKRGGLEVGSAVTDVVAGTFGANLKGGSANSVMAILLLMVFGFFLAHWKEGRLKFLYVVLALPFLLVPIGLAEVKVAVVLLPLMILVIFKDEVLRRPSLFLGMALIAGILTTILGYVYTEFIIRKPLEQVVQETLNYNIGAHGYGFYVLNRLTALTFWWQQQGFHDPVGFLFGHGLGSSFSTPGTLVYGHIAARWPMYGIDLTAASSLLWDVGVAGLVLFLLVCVLAWRTCGCLLRETEDPSQRADVAAIRGVIPLLGIFVFYNNTLVSLVTMQILLYLILGYLAFLWRTRSPGGARA
jgi:hypothetical protein